MARTRWRRSLIVGALLLAAAVITAVQYERLATQSYVPGPDDPPAGVQLLYFVDPSHPHTLVAYDWAGHRRGTIKVPSWVVRSQLRMAPDGSGFALDPGFSGDYAAYFDRLGRTLFETDSESFEAQIWAADGRHVCLLALTASGAALVTRLPGFGDHAATISPRANVSDAPLALQACSTTSDSAIVVAAIETGPGEPYVSRVARLRLSTGAVLGARDFTANVLSSPDGAYLATVSADGESVKILRAGDLGTPIGTLDPSLVPLAFSGDDQLLLATDQDQRSLEVVNWKTGRTSWRLDVPSNGFGAALARPAGRDFAIVLNGGDAAGVVSVVLAHPDGSSTNLRNGNPVAW